MKGAYLQVTYRRGKAIAAYYSLPHRPGERIVGSREIEPELVADLGRGGRLIGIEILSPETVTLTQINRVLRTYGLPRIPSTELRPLRAA